MDAPRGVSDGLTLVELLGALVVISVLLAAAIPAFDKLTERKTLTGVERTFFVSLANAKQAAVTRNRRVSLCPTYNGSACLGQGRWHRGWMTFVDTDADRRPDPGEPVLERHGPLRDGVRLTSSRYRRIITFQPEGTAGGSNATFTLCLDGSPTNVRAIVLSRLGRIRLDKGDPEDCRAPLGKS